MLNEHGHPGIEPDVQFPTKVWDGLSQSRRQKIYRAADADDYNSIVGEIQAVQRYLKPDIWTLFDLLNNWINIGVILPQYKIIGNRLYLRGKIISQVNFDGLLAFTLPYGPIDDVILKVFASNTNNDNGMKLLINTLGNAYFYNVNTIDIIDLSLVSFSID